MGIEPVGTPHLAHARLAHPGGLCHQGAAPVGGPRRAWRSSSMPRCVWHRSWPADRCAVRRAASLPARAPESVGGGERSAAACIQSRGDGNVLLASGSSQDHLRTADLARWLLARPKLRCAKPNGRPAGVITRLECSEIPQSGFSWRQWSLGPCSGLCNTPMFSRRYESCVVSCKTSIVPLTPPKRSRVHSEMPGENVFLRHPIVVEEAVGGFRARPVLAGEGHTLRRTVGELIEQPPESFAQAFVGKRPTLELTLDHGSAIVRLTHSAVALLRLGVLHGRHSTTEGTVAGFWARDIASVASRDLQICG